jgi:hypothetical protein
MRHGKKTAGLGYGPVLWTRLPYCHARIMFKTWWLVLGETSSPTTHPPPSDRPLHTKTKVVVVTGIKKNSDFGSLPDSWLENGRPPKSIFQKKLPDRRTGKFSCEKILSSFFRLNFFEKSGRGKPTSFWIFDFGDLPFSNHVSPQAQTRNSS